MLLAREVVGEFGLLSVPFVHSCVPIRLHFLHGTIATTVNIQGVPVLVCQTKLGDRDHRSKKILSKDPCPEMNRLASRRM